MTENLSTRTELWTPPRLISEDKRGHWLTRMADVMVPVMEKWTKSKEVPENKVLLGLLSSSCGNGCPELAII